MVSQMFSEAELVVFSSTPPFLFEKKPEKKKRHVRSNVTVAGRTGAGLRRVRGLRQRGKADNKRIGGLPGERAGARADGLADEHAGP